MGPGRCRHSLLGAVALAPVLALGVLVFMLSVNVPYWDQWELAPIIRKLHTGSLEAGDLLARHNEHCILVPRTLMLGLAVMTDWNLRAEVLVNFCLGCGLVLLLRGLLAKTLSAGRAFIWYRAALAWIVLSPAQWENWLWGWQMQLLLCVLGAVGSVRCLAESRDGNPGRGRGLAAAVLCAVAGSYSMAAGMFIWAAGAALLAWGRDWRRLVLWAIAAAVALTPLLFFMAPASHAGSWRLLRYYPTEYALYVCAYLGGSFALPPAAAAAAGLALIVLWGGGLARLAAIRPAALARLAPWNALAIFALVNALATGVGRLGFGFEQATASRYGTFSMLFVLAAALVAIEATAAAAPAAGLLGQSGARRRRLGAALAAVLAAALLHGWWVGTGLMIVHHWRLRDTRACLRQLDSADIACLLASYPRPELLAERARYLASIGWGGLGGP